MIAAPFAVAIVGLLLERTVIRRFYAAPVAAMLGTYAIGLALREGVRGSARRTVLFGDRAAGRLLRSRRRLHFQVAHRGDS